MIDRRRWSAAVLAALGVGRARAAVPGASAPAAAGTGSGPGADGSAPAADDAAPAPARGAAAGAPASASPRVLRYAFEVAETSLDPVKVTDLYSRFIIAHLYEGLYHYDHLARPVKIKPLLAAGMPEVSADFRTWTVPLRPGVYFRSDPAFKGARRELVAEDIVYSWKRFADPANRSPGWTEVETTGFVGLRELRQQALDTRRPFDYDRPIDGIRALDRYTVRFQLQEGRPRLIEMLAEGDLHNAIAREVVEFYGDQLEAHPVGTGPFRLAHWRRSSLIVLERSPEYREHFYDAEPAEGDAEGRAIAARFKGRRLPMLDRVEIAIVEEEQPRWLSFVNGEADLAYRVGYQFASQAMPNGKVAPNLARRGIRGFPIVESAGQYWYFNMEDPLVGGYTPEKIALRRAIGLGIDVRTLIAYAYGGLGTVAQGATLPGTTVYDRRIKTEFSDFDPARAKALLDVYGHRLGPDGRRAAPDGTPLMLKVATTQNARDRKIAEVLTKNMKVLGIGVESLTAQWPENLKAARAGKLQMWALGGISSGPDAEGSYARFDSRQVGNQNFARIKLARLDALHDRLQLLPDGPERLAAFREIDRIALAYMPYKFTLNRVSIDMVQPHLIGYRRPLFWNDFWQYLDIDEHERRRG